MAHYFNLTQKQAAKALNRWGSDFYYDRGPHCSGNVYVMLDSRWNWCNSQSIDVMIKNLTKQGGEVQFKVEDSCAIDEIAFEKYLSTTQ